MTSPRLHRTGHTQPWFDLVDSCKDRGCPVCTLLTRVVHGYFDHLLYEDVNDVGVRAQLRQSSGFCRTHAAVLLTSGNPLGIAIMYQDILQHVYGRLRTGQPGPLGPGPRCPACIYRDQFEAMYLGVIAGDPIDGELTRALRSSEGLCLQHLRQLADRLHTEARSNVLLQDHERKIEAFRKHLTEFLRKQDIHHQDEVLSSEEETACERAIDFLVGSER